MPATPLLLEVSGVRKSASPSTNARPYIERQAHAPSAGGIRPRFDGASTTSTFTPLPLSLLGRLVRSACVMDELARRSAWLSRPLCRDLLVGDLALKHDDPVEERLGPRRTPGNEHVDRDDLVERPWSPNRSPSTDHRRWRTIRTRSRTWVDLELVETRTFSSRVVYLRHRVAR
jgi:hypothetical protein